MRETVSIHCDGSYHPETQSGGWGAVVKWRDKRWEVGGPVKANSSLYAEHHAIEKALRAVPEGHPVVVFSDCLAVIARHKAKMKRQNVRLVFQHRENDELRAAHSIAYAFMVGARSNEKVT